MLTTLNRVVGMPVVLRDACIGYVERALADEDYRWLQGLVIRRGIGLAHWLPRESILLIGQECVLAGQAAKRMPSLQERQPVQAFLATGQWVGLVSDAVLQGDTMQLKALEISKGPLYSLFGSRDYARQYHIAREASTGRAVVQRLTTWTQLQGSLREGEEEWTF